MGQGSGFIAVIVNTYLLYHGIWCFVQLVCLGFPAPVCLSFVTISSGLCLLIPISDPPFPNYRGGPIQRGWIMFAVSSGQFTPSLGLTLLFGAQRLRQIDQGPTNPTDRNC